MRLDRPTKGAFFCQAVNPQDEILGFVIGWIKALAGKLESLEVVTLEAHPAQLPENVRVHSLGKERGAGRLARSVTSLRVLAKVAARSQFMLCHMAPAYALAAKPWFRSKTLALWYTHQHVDKKLKAAVAVSDLVFTAAEKTMNVATSKKRVVGHGIDPAFFETQARPPGQKPLQAVTVGRLSPRKNLEAIIEAAQLLAGWGRGGDWFFTIIGAPGTPDQAAYLAGLKDRISRAGLAGAFRFTGHLPHAQIAQALAGADVFISSQIETGFDKAVLEAMAVGLPALAAHPAYLEVLAGDGETLFFEGGRAGTLADKLSLLAGLEKDKRLALGGRLKERVRSGHSLDRLMDRILDELAVV